MGIEPVELKTGLDQIDVRNIIALIPTSLHPTKPKHQASINRVDNRINKINHKDHPDPVP